MKNLFLLKRHKTSQRFVSDVDVCLAVFANLFRTVFFGVKVVQTGPTTQNFAIFGDGQALAERFVCFICSHAVIFFSL